MAFTWGSKVNGILTVFTIGIAVLVDLWDILDVRKGYTMVRYAASFSGALPIHVVLGTLLETLCCQSSGIDRCAHRSLPGVLLRAFCRSHSLWNWRHIHEPCVPRNPDRK